MHSRPKVIIHKTNCIIFTVIKSTSIVYFKRRVKEIKSPPDVLVVFLTASEVLARKRRGLWPRLFQIRPHLLLKVPKGRLGAT